MMRKRLMGAVTVLAMAAMAAGCAMVKAPADEASYGGFSSNRDVRANADATGTHFFPAKLTNGTGVTGLGWGW